MDARKHLWSRSSGWEPLLSSSSFLTHVLMRGWLMGTFCTRLRTTTRTDVKIGLDICLDEL